MDRLQIMCLGIVLLSLSSVFPTATLAEIYKWTDSDGKVHFGDKPKDSANAKDAQPVQLTEGYRPSERTAAEQEVYDQEQRAITLRNDMRRQDQAEASNEALEERRKEKAELCEAYAARVERLSTVPLKDGVRHIIYATGEDGKPVSAQRQEEIVEELKTQMKNAGCV